MRTRLSIDLASGAITRLVGGVAVPEDDNAILTAGDVFAPLEVIFTNGADDVTAAVLPDGAVLKIGVRAVPGVGDLLAQSEAHTINGSGVAECAFSLNTTEMLAFVDALASTVTHTKVYLEVEVDDVTLAQERWVLRREVNRAGEEPPPTAATSATTATAQAVIATTQAGFAATAKAAADNDVVLTHADVVFTHADVITTGNAVTTATEQAGIATTQAGFAATAKAAADDDVVLTHADVVLTHGDVITTGNAVTTATGQAVIATTQAGFAATAKAAADADVVLTHADVVSTHVDAATTAAFAAGNTVLFSHYADAGNVTTGETDLYSDSIPGTVFNADGTALRAEYGLALVGSTSTKKVKAYFGGTAIFDTGALTVTTAGGLQIAIVLIRAGSSSVRYEVSATGTNTGTLAFSATGTVTGLTLTAAQILKLTGTAASTGAATNDIVAKLARAATSSDNGAGLATYVANNRTALAPRGGLAFDGTSLARITGPLGLVGTVGTDPFSDVLFCSVPTANPATGQLLFELHSGTVGFVASVVFASINTSGGLDIVFIDSSTTNRRVATVANFVSSYGGKVVMVAIVRSATGLLIYINGVSVAFAETPTGSPASFATMSVAAGSSAGYTIGSYDGATMYVGTLFSFSHYNLALAASDVLEIYERDGGVPERFKFGSQTLLNASTFTQGTYTTFSGASSTGFTATYTGSSGVITGGGAGTTPLTVKVGQKVRIKVTLTVNSGQVPGVAMVYPSGFSYTGTQSLSAGPNVLEVPVNNQNSGGFTTVSLAFSSSAATDFYISGASLTQLGAIVHLPLTDGAGFQPKDASANALHGTLTANGISHMLPAPIGARFGYVMTFHHTDISTVSGSTAVGICPAGWVPVDFQCNITAAFDAGRTISLGTAGSSALYVSALAADTTGLKQATPLVPTPPSLTANTTLYLKKSSTTTVGDLVTVNVVLERKY